MWRRTCVVSLLIALADTAGARSLYPPGGAVSTSPTLWLTTNRMPTIEITDDNGPVTFEIDELQVESGPRRIALRPQVGDGSFTVTLDGHAVRYQADPTLDHVKPDVELVRIGIERVAGKETFVIDAEAEPGTVLYLLNHRSSRARVNELLLRHVWVGPGKSIARPPGERAMRRYEVPLAALGVSCARGSAELVAYTTRAAGHIDVHQPLTLEIADGQASFDYFGSGHGTQQPCIGAAIAPRIQLAVARISAAPVIGSGPTTTDFSSLGRYTDEAIYGGLLGPAREKDGPRQWREGGTTHQQSDAISRLSGWPTSERDDSPPWWIAPLGLAGIALVMWRATARVTV